MAHRAPHRHLLAGLVVVALLVAAAVTGMTVAASSARAAGETVVSLTFDDGRATAYNARAILAAHAMKGTFYVNSPQLESSAFFLTDQQVRDLSADGNEIGGHSLYHADLRRLDAAEVSREICVDRAKLLALGLPVRSFAYPYGAYNSAAQAAAQACGYTSARSTDVPASGVADTIPPADPYAIRLGTGSLKLADLEAAVQTAVQSGGGWVPLMFHDVCDGGCSSVAISPADFSALLDWLSARTGDGVVVKTVGDVMGGPVAPAQQGAPIPDAVGGVSVVHNASLEYADDGYVPDCFEQAAFGDNRATWSRTTDAHTGSAAQRLDLAGYVSGQGALMTRQDAGACTPTVLPGHGYLLSAWYKSSAPVAFDVETRTSSRFAFSYWTAGPDLPAAATWTLASWVTPALPAGAGGMSFGLALGQNGSLTVDDVAIVDALARPGPDAAPSVTLTSPAAGATVSGTLAITASASDDVALDHVGFLVDGAVVGTRVTGPQSITWNSRTVANGSHTLTAVAVDSAGHATTSAARGVVVLNQNANLLKNASFEDGTPDGGPTCWVRGGYGTNTFTWTRTSDAHTGTAAESVLLASWTDGDRKLLSAMDAGACAPAAVPGHTYTVSAWHLGDLPSYFYAFYRAADGTWTYLAQSARVPSGTAWRQDSWQTPPIPAGATHLSVGLGGSGTGTLTMDDFSLQDDAPIADTTPPTSTISCNDGVAEDSCSGWFTAAPTVHLTASDGAEGSGVAAIRWTSDGSDPTTASTLYTGPFTASGTVAWRAYDAAGNAEAVHRQVLRVDTVVPTATIRCNLDVCPGWARGPVTVTFDVREAGSGLAAVRYTLDGTQPSATTGLVYAGQFTVTSTTTVTYRAIDLAGNIQPTATARIQIDRTPPTGAVTSPVAGSLVSGIVTITASASDDVAVQRVDLLVDGVVVDAAWNSATVADGTHTISARIVDTAGNMTTTPGVSVLVSNRNLLVNASLETPGKESLPQCWALSSKPDNKAWSAAMTRTAHTGSYGETVTVSQAKQGPGGEREFLVTKDVGQCAPAVTAGATYVVSAWYLSGARPHLSVYVRDAKKRWTYWTGSADLAPTGTWAQASLTLPAIPAGVTAISVGFGDSAVGTFTMDDLGLFRIR